MYRNPRIINLENELVPVNGANRQEQTVSTSVVTLGPFNEKTTHVYISLDANNVRVTFDGQNPSSTEGHLLTAPFIDVWHKRLAAAAKFIRVSADAKLVVQELTTG